MAPAEPTAHTVDEYIASFPPEVRKVLEAIRARVRAAAPEAEERMEYGMPTYRQNGNLVHFAAFTSHVGFYPTSTGIAHFDEALAPYRRAKGSVRFPLDVPVPLDLIEEIVRFRVEEDREEDGRPREPRGATDESEVRLPLSDAAVERRTGRPWRTWFELLDAWDASSRTHTEIAAWLEAEHGVDAWSAQSIVVGFERVRGGRGLGERPGGFEISASKTVEVDVVTLFRMVLDESARGGWLPEDELRLRTATEPKSARFDWGDGTTRVNVTFAAKGERKSSLTVQHERLRDEQEAGGRKAFWSERLAVLKEVVER